MTDLKSYFHNKLLMFGSSKLSFEESEAVSANFTLNCSTFISLMSVRCCNSSVNHCGFIHLAINLSPRGAAALSMNLNVWQTATSGLQISVLVVVLRGAVWEGSFFCTFLQIFCFCLSSVCLSLHLQAWRKQRLAASQVSWIWGYIPCAICSVYAAPSLWVKLSM